jgi:hypothetical protein
VAASADWVSHCRADQADGGAIEALRAFDDEELAEISKSHDNDAGKLPLSPAVEEETFS